MDNIVLTKDGPAAFCLIDDDGRMIHADHFETLQGAVEYARYSGIEFDIDYELIAEYRSVLV